MSDRIAKVERTTKESSISVEINLDGTGRTDISTGIPFYDHMLTALGKHSLIDLTVTATGDTHIDAHHTVEDVAICLGEALRAALGDKRGIARFGDATVPLDEARKKLGAYADALALDQRVRGPRARSLGWSPTLHSVGMNVPRLLEEFRRAQERAA